MSEVPGVINHDGTEYEKEIVERIAGLCYAEESAQAFFNVARAAYVEKLLFLFGRVEKYDVFFVLIYKITKESISNLSTIHEAFFPFDKYMEVNAWLSLSPELFETVLIRDFDSGKFKSFSVSDAMKSLSKMMENKDEVNQLRRKRYGETCADE
jgi:hypothetical protein